MKRLKDYPLNQWLEAAGECPQCQSKSVQAMVTWVDESGDIGDVSLKCLVCGFTDSDIAGWIIGSQTHLILGKRYLPLTSRANVGPCVACEKIVVGVPLILFIEEGRDGEFDFCFSCAEKQGILESIVK